MSDAYIPGFVDYCRPDTPERWREREFALRNSYFWIPCPLCGNTFGGHEWVARINLPLGQNVTYSAGVCPQCEAELKAESDAEKRRMGWE